jgi:arginine exporter protein ArgO
MVLILLVCTLAALPLIYLGSFGKLALLSAYAGLAHLLVLVVIAALFWFGMRRKAIYRAWLRKRH